VEDRANMAQWLRLAFVAILTAAVLALIRRLLRQATPIALDAVSGSIRPEKITAAFTVVVGAGMAIGGTVGVLSGSGGWGAALALVGLAIAGFMAPSLTSLHTVNWGADGIEGPSRLFGPTLGVARTRIAWSEIARTGSTSTGFWYVETNDKRRVYWSYLYKGHGALGAVLAAHCPQLPVPRL
jgi:hypothetical protein